VEQYDQWRAQGHPLQGEGANPRIAGSGWDKAWDVVLEADKAALTLGLLCDPKYNTWPPDSQQDHDPINCVNWYQAFEFCAWDGGHLPTEAEWEYAAAGGDKNRLFPWGSTMPGNNTDLALYGCYYNGSGVCVSYTNLAPVGTAPGDRGRWGHADLAGSVAEWTFDFWDPTWFSKPAASGTDVANLTPNKFRTAKGNSFYGTTQTLRPAYRAGDDPRYGWFFYGVRCARSAE